MKLFKKIILCILPLSFILLVFLFKDFILMIFRKLPTCAFYKAFALPCPGCGNTRSVFALMNFDLLSSIKFNPAPFFLSILGMCFYFEYVFWIFNKKIKIVPRNKYFLFGTLFIFITYYIIRIFTQQLWP